MPELRKLSFIELDKQMAMREISGGAPVYPYTIYNEDAGFDCLLDRNLPDAFANDHHKHDNAGKNIKDMEDAQVKALSLA